MTNSSSELDLFGNNDQHNVPARHQLPPPMERPNFMDVGIQSAMTKIDRELLRSLSSSFSFAPAPLNTNPAGFTSPPFPVLRFSSRCGNGSIPVGTCPLTIFYDGRVTVVDLPRNKADAIIKRAEEGSVTSGGSLGKLKDVGEKLEEDLMPMARRKSLQQFLQKRKERVVGPGPYGRMMKMALG